MQELGIYVSAGTLAAVIGYAVRLTWKVRDIERDIQKNVDDQIEKVDAQIENVARDVSSHRTSTADRFESVRHETGEMGSALRTKIHEVETWNRDTFVRKESFELIVGRIEKSIEKLGDKLEDKLERAFDRITRQD